MADKSNLIAQLGGSGTGYFPDNNNKDITPQRLRDYLTLLINNSLFVDDNFSNDVDELTNLTSKAWSIQAIKDYVAGTGGVSSGIQVTYEFDTGTTAGAGSGEMRLNNATPASATLIYFNDISSNGDASGIISSLTAASQIIFQDPTDIDTYQVFDVTDVPTDLSGEWSVPVTHASGGSTTITDGNDVSVLMGLGSQGFNHVLTQNLDAQSNKIINLDDGTASGDAVNLSQLEAVQALIEILRNGTQTLSVSAGAITWDLSTDSPLAEVELDANVTTFTISNQNDHTTIHLVIKQDATGSRTMVAPTGYTATGGSFDINSNGNSYTLATFVKTTSYQVASTDYDGTGGSGSTIGDYTTWSALLLDQAGQTEGLIYRADDASGHPDITTGYAYFEYLGTSAGDETDYNIIAVEEDRARITAVEGEIDDKVDKATAAINLNTLTEYPSLSSALSAATSGQTVRLFKYQAGSTLVVGSNVTLDLGGNLISYRVTLSSGANIRNGVVSYTTTTTSNEFFAITAAGSNDIDVDIISLNDALAIKSTGSNVFVFGNIICKGSGPTSVLSKQVQSIGGELTISGNVYATEEVNTNSLLYAEAGFIKLQGDIYYEGTKGAAVNCSNGSDIYIYGSIYAPNHNNTTYPLILFASNVAGYSASDENNVYLYGKAIILDGFNTVGAYHPAVNNFYVLQQNFTNGFIDDFGVDSGEVTVNYITPLEEATGGIEEAPEDGTPYARQDADWVQVPTSSSLPEGYDLTATNIFVDTGYSGTEAGTINQPYSGITEAVTALEATTGSQHVHVYLKAGTIVPPIRVETGKGKDRFQRNKIATYGGTTPAIIGQAYQYLSPPTFTQVGATDVWTTPQSNIAGFYLFGQRMKRSTDGVVHTISATTADTITSPTFSTYGDLVNCFVDVQVTPYDCRTLRILSRSGTTITVDITEGGALSFLGGGVTHSCKLYGMRDELEDEQWASESVSGDGLIAIMSESVDPNTTATLPYALIAMYDESSIHIGEDAASDSSFWEFENLDLAFNGRDGIEVYGDYSAHKYTNIKIISSMRAGHILFGSYDNDENYEAEINNLSITDYGAQGAIYYRPRVMKADGLRISYGQGHDDGEMYGFRFQPTGSNGLTVFGSGLHISHYRDVGGGDPLADALSNSEFKNVVVDGTYENGIVLGGYGNRLTGYVRNHSRFTTDTAGVYLGGDYTHGNSQDKVTVYHDGDLSLCDQYVSTVGDVHGFYTDFYSNTNHHRDCTSYGHIRGHGFFQNISAHYNLYEDCLGANNREQFHRADVFSGTPNPSRHAVRRRNTWIAINRGQKCLDWLTTGTDNDPFDDYDPGEQDSDLCISLNEGAVFGPRRNGVNSSRASEGVSFEAWKETMGVDKNSTYMGLWDRLVVSDYEQVAEIVDAAATPDFTADSTGITANGAVSYNATDDCYEVTPGDGLTLNVGDIDTTNTLNMTNAYVDDNPSSGEVITFVMEIEADQDGMYFDWSIYNGVAYESRPRVALKRGTNTYIVQHICESNFTGSWFCQMRPYKSTNEDDLVYRFHSLYVYQGTGTEYGPINFVQNIIVGDSLLVSNIRRAVFSNTEKATDGGMMLPAGTSGVTFQMADLSEASPDTTAPTVVSATVSDANPDELVVVFSEAVNITDTTGLTLSGDLGDVSETNILINFGDVGDLTGNTQTWNELTDENSLSIADLDDDGGTATGIGFDLGGTWSGIDPSYGDITGFDSYLSDDLTGVGDTHLTDGGGSRGGTVTLSSLDGSKEYEIYALVTGESSATSGGTSGETPGTGIAIVTSGEGTDTEVTFNEDDTDDFAWVKIHPSNTKITPDGSDEITFDIQEAGGLDPRTGDIMITALKIVES